MWHQVNPHKKEEKYLPIALEFFFVLKQFSVVVSFIKNKKVNVKNVCSTGQLYY